MLEIALEDLVPELREACGTNSTWRLFIMSILSSSFIVYEELPLCEIILIIYLFTVV